MRRTLFLTLALMLLFTLPVYAESGVDFIQITPTDTLECSKGSRDAVFIVTTDFKPEGVVLETPLYSQIRYYSPVTRKFGVRHETSLHTQYLDVRFIQSPETKSEFYRTTIYSEAIDLFLADKPVSEPLYLKIIGDNRIVQFYIPEVEAGIYPVPGHDIILEDYGNPRNNQYKYHHGVDISTPPEGVPIVNALSGKLVYSGENPDMGWYGKHIIIEHKREDKLYWVLYGHLSQINSFEVGELIPQGQILGISGNTIYSGANIPHHLHFEIRDITEGDTSVNSAIHPLSFGFYGTDSPIYSEYK